MADGVPLPENWIPTDDDRAYGLFNLNLTDSQINDMAEDMRLWAYANTHRAVGRKSGLKGWSMAFKGWMRRNFKGQSNGYGRSRSLQNDEQSVSKAAGRAETAAKTGQFSIGPRPSLLPISGPDDLRLLSKG